MLWDSLLRPLLFQADPEATHYAAMNSLQQFARIPGALSTLAARTRCQAPGLETNLWGLKFHNPVGLAAGFDKDARWHRELAALGFGFIEVGTITDVEQPGNPKPRLFRLPTDQAILNRMGFNNDGAEKAAARLEQNSPNTVLGINIGKSKVTPNEQATQSYLSSLRKLWNYADYITVNVSSPNTPGLRQLQDRGPLLELLHALSEENRRLAESEVTNPKPLLVKIAPDMSEAQLDDVVDIAFQANLSGIIATNTTISREHLRTRPQTVTDMGAGGISGKPLTERSRQVIRHLYRQTRQKLTLIGVGGIFNGDDAWRMMAAGANLVQVYTGFIYGGPMTVRNINRRLLERMQRESVRHISEIVGQDS